MRLIYFLLLLFPGLLTAQMTNEAGATVYGDEWLSAEGTHVRLDVAADGWYRIGTAELALGGWTLENTPAAQWRLHHAGAEMPLQVTDEGLYFYGRRNRAEMDRYLYENPETDLLNPEYSLYTDTAAYYLSVAAADAGPGRRFETIANAPAGTAINRVTRQALTIFGEYPIKQFLRVNPGISIYYSNYEPAEGFAGRSENDLLSFDGNTTTTAMVPLPGYAIGETVDVTARFALGFDEHAQEMRLNGTVMETVTGSGWSVEEISAQTGGSGAAVELQLKGTAGDRDKAALAYVRAVYPALPTAQGASELRFYLPAGGARRLIVSELGGTGTAELYDLTAGLRLTGETADFMLPATAEEHEYLLVRAGTGAVPAAAAAVQPRPAAQEDFDYLVVTSRRLRTGNDQVATYADYRRSAAGGGYRVRVVDVEDLYDSHGYGLRRHPQAIRNYVAEARTYAPSLKFLLLLGKGREYRDLRTNEQVAANSEVAFVPSFGYPATDNLLTAELGEPTPGLATGRLTAIAPADVPIYLDKVRQFEANRDNPQTLAERDWTKQIIHLGGGGNAAEQQSIRFQLEFMENVIENNRFGGNVTSFYKRSTDAIELSISESIFQRVNEGSTIMTFFGHSSPGTFDINIDNFDNYVNRSKTPLLLSLGCYSGNMFGPVRGIGERFIFLPEYGAIAFGAARGIGYVGSLGSLGRQFYTQAGGEQYGEGIGEILRQTIFAMRDFGGFQTQTLLQQYSLQGDPAIRLHPRPGPDYVLDPATARFSPDQLTADRDSFRLTIDLKNIGSKGTADSLDVQFRQRNPGGTVVDLGRVRVAAPAYATELNVNLPVGGAASVGLNTLLATVDAADEVAELPAPAAELNNELRNAAGTATGLPYLVAASTAQPVYPYDNALLTAAPTLTASPSDPLSPARRYRLEMDTSSTFNSPLITTEIETRGLIEWTPNLVYRDSTVYYWRISPDSSQTVAGTYLWETRSFTYLSSGQPGLGQSHGGQWATGDRFQLVHNDTTGWEFDALRISIRVKNKVFESDDRPGWVYNSESLAGSIRPYNFLNEGLAVVVVNPILADATWLNPEPGQGFAAGDYGVPTGGSRVFAFPTQTTAQRANFIEFVEDVVPAGWNVFVWTTLKFPDSRVYAQEWAADSLLLGGKNIFNVLEAQGATETRELIDNDRLPYIFVYRKGVEPKNEIIAADPSETINAETFLPRRFNTGTYQSARLGPARAWTDLRWRARLQAGDSMKLDVYGFAPDDSPVLLRSSDAPGTLDLSGIDAATYPYLRVTARFADAMDIPAAPQLDYINLNYQPAPDLLFDSGTYLRLPADTLTQGETYRLGIAVANPTPIAVADSIDLSARLLDQSGGLLTQRTERRAALPARDTLHFDLELPTAEISSNTQLLLEINPARTFLEQTYANNSLQVRTTLNVDRVNPTVLVTFDGRTINDGDLVSARPRIEIELRDENEFLLLDNPELFTLRIRYPDGQTVPLALTDPGLEFLPAASSSDNRARIRYAAQFPQDGTYELQIEARDVRGNSAGQLSYAVRFEVINALTISQLVNYPNPFSTRTFFVYELTGEVPPERYQIRILTVSGRVVRTLTEQDLGPLEIGRHQTPLSWDGTDRYGDRLANGVYFYQIDIRDAGGNQVERRGTALDQYFEGGVGKLVILR
ncbi:MAG: C25 family cysteine peptidase [Saprospiraceae bacterium]